MTVETDGFLHTLEEALAGAEDAPARAQRREADAALVDLAPAHRRAIPAQPPPLPDMDAYASRPGSALLVPAAADRPPRSAGHRAAADGAVDTLPRTARLLPQGPPHSRADGGILLWDEQGGDGPEQHAQLWLRLHQREDDDGKRLPVRLVYRAADRYAITAVFNAGTDEERTWVFARDLLADGLHHSIGIGDVIVWPGPDEPHHADDRRRIFIRLRSPEGTALLSMAREDATAFLDASEPLTERAATAASADSLSAGERSPDGAWVVMRAAGRWWGRGRGRVVWWVDGVRERRGCAWWGFRWALPVPHRFFRSTVSANAIE